MWRFLLAKIQPLAPLQRYSCIIFRGNTVKFLPVLPEPSATGLSINELLLLFDYFLTTFYREKQGVLRCFKVFVNNRKKPATP